MGFVLLKYLSPCHLLSLVIRDSACPRNSDFQWLCSLCWERQSHGPRMSLSILAGCSKNARHWQPGPSLGAVLAGSSNLQGSAMSPSGKIAGLLLFTIKTTIPASPVFFLCNASIHRSSLALPQGTWGTWGMEAKKHQVPATAFALSNKVLCLRSGVSVFFLPAPMNQSTPGPTQLLTTCTLVSTLWTAQYVLIQMKTWFRWLTSHLGDSAF